MGSAMAALLLADGSSRVSVTTNTWTKSRPGSFYSAFTGHLIDKYWRFHQILLDFVSSPAPASQSGEETATLFWNNVVVPAELSSSPSHRRLAVGQRFMGFTLSDISSDGNSDNSNNNDDGNDKCGSIAATVRQNYEAIYNRPMMLSGKLAHTKCCARMLFMIAKVGLDLVTPVVLLLRDDARAIHSSLTIRDAFLEHRRTHYPVQLLDAYYE
jgi:hypothetical protein